jgi:hypothetical protein
MIRRSPRAFSLLLALTSPLGAACTASIGAEAARPVSEPGASVGGQIEGLVHFSRGRSVLSRGEGPVAGTRVEVLRRVAGATDQPWQPRFAVLAGYSASPLPYRPRVGIEPIVALGYGAYPVGGSTRGSLSAGARIAVPVRLTPNKPAWDTDAIADLTPMIVPFLGASLYYPVERGSDSIVRGEMNGGLLIRCHLWSPLSP